MTRRLATPESPRSGATGPRLVGVDATRGIAVLGMMAVHALYVVDAAGDPTRWFSLAGGRSAATFAVLAGVGIAFTTRRRQVPAAEARPTAASLTARAFAIGTIGLVLGYTDASIAAVILPYYAVLFLLAIPLVFLTTRWLVMTGVAAAVVVPVVSHPLRDALPEPRLINPSFGYLFSDPLRLLSELSLTGTYPALPWMAYLCAGLIVGRLRLSSARVAGGLLGAGALLATAASLLSWLLLGPLGGRQQLEAASSIDVARILAFGPTGTTPTSTWWWLAIDTQHSSTPPDLLHTTGIAVALLAAMLLLTHVVRPVLRRVIIAVLTPLAAVGALTLTVYTAHVVFMNSPLDSFGAVTGYVVQVVVALAVALAWRQAVGRGPLEAGVTWLARRARSAATRAPSPART
ncbi:MAG: DUF1624 domain-containing protein [Pseudonocardiaceae bacterium]|nr:DUF1624 domain-containing protein [Pseudonocardiaceae bacterium]